MSVLDQRVDQLHHVTSQMRRAPTFGAFLWLEQQRMRLQRALRDEMDDLQRLSQGWVYVPPRVR